MTGERAGSESGSVPTLRSRLREQVEQKWNSFLTLSLSKVTSGTEEQRGRRGPPIPTPASFCVARAATSAPSFQTCLKLKVPVLVQQKTSTYFRKRPEFSSQYPHDGSQPPLTPASGDLMPSSDLLTYQACA